MALTNKELFAIKGGAFTFSATYFNAISRFMTTIIKLGQLAGSSLRRAITRSYCQFFLDLWGNLVIFC